MALHDCNGDVNKAINTLLEGSSDTVSTVHSLAHFMVAVSVSLWVEAVQRGWSRLCFGGSVLGSVIHTVDEQ